MVTRSCRFTHSGTCFHTSSSSDSFPCSARSMTLSAVNGFAIDAGSKMVAGVIGTFCSRLAIP